jgi:hypothetical protein
LTRLRFVNLTGESVLFPIFPSKEEEYSYALLFFSPRHPLYRTAFAVAL